MSKLISLENLGVFVNLLGIDSAFSEMEESEIISQEKLENSVEDILSEYIDLTLLDSDKSLTLRQKKILYEFYLKKEYLILKVLYLLSQNI
ncbi:hypothetical protein [Rodentibacter pneumotropicus]|uniref:hypothetical protein n=1 Tax=Rodentibacter pneumotropicus TaxID=758 RepID=UPI001EE22F2A|nr:hypothetical protein [Rodentibacter pneumotropicus]